MMKVASTSMVLAAAVAGMAGADALVRGPYLQQAGTDRMTVCWRGGEAAGRVRFGTDPAVLDLTAEEASAPVAPFDHAVELTGLRPATGYYYEVGGADGWSVTSPEFRFTTPPVPGAAVPLRLWALGDAGTAGVTQGQVRDAFRAWTGNRTPDFVLQLGDNAYFGGEDVEFQNAMFLVYQAELSRVPFWSCLGNHETYNIPPAGEDHPYFKIYQFPTAGECGGCPSGTERYYSFDYGNVHFISLDSTQSDRSAAGEMAGWLQCDLAASTATWIVAFFHHPPYTRGSHNSDTEVELLQMRSNILPILEAGGVDLVLSGHSHSYERSPLLDGHYGASGTLVAGMIRDGGDGRIAGTGAYRKPLTGPRGHHGTVYCVTGSAGQNSGGLLNHPAHQVSHNLPGSTAIDISGNRLDATFITHSGEIRDSFTLIKQDTPDTDQDGMPDEYEILHGLDRLSLADAQLDRDGDGTSNLDEYVFGRSASVPDGNGVVVGRDPASGNPRVSFPSVPGRVYRVRWNATLDAGGWQAGSGEMAGTGGLLVWTDASAAAGSRFYRVEGVVVER